MNVVYEPSSLNDIHKQFLVIVAKSTFQFCVQQEKNRESNVQIPFVLLILVLKFENRLNFTNFQLRFLK